MAEVQVNLVCKECGKPFTRRLGEFNRSIRLGRVHVCSLTCSARHSNRTLRPAETRHDLRTTPYAGDEYTPYRPFLRKAKGRGWDVTVTLPELKQIWEAQEGKCPLTGWELSSEFSPGMASIDRIDSTKGYISGNVRFISFMANLALRRWPDEELFDFAEAIVRHQASLRDEDA